MPISRIPGVGLDSGSSGIALSNLSATGTPGVTTFLRGDNTWSSTMTSGTAVTASGTSVDFTGIPAGVKRITVMLNGVSTNGVSLPLAQLGTISGVTTTGYAAGNIESGTGRVAFTTGFGLVSSSAQNILYGHMVFTNITANTWVASQNVVLNQAGTYYTLTGGGSIALAATLDRVRITTVNGTDTFDAGTINLLWE